MTSLRWLRWSVALTAATLVAASGASLVRAHAARTTALKQYAHARTLVVELNSLRTAQEVVALGPRPEAGLLDILSMSIVTAGISQTALHNLTPESESPVGTLAGARYFRQRARLTLADITLPDLGRWLTEWRRTAKAWTVTSIDITPAKPTSSLRHTEPPRLRASIILEALYVVESQPTQSMPTRNP